MIARPLGVILVLLTAACSATVPSGNTPANDPTQPGLSQDAGSQDAGSQTAGSQDEVSGASSTAPPTSPPASADGEGTRNEPSTLAADLAAISRWSNVSYEIPDAVSVGSVVDFGAVPDDGVSDSAAFARAVAAAAAADAPAALDIPAGEFELTETLKLPSGVVLRGQGPATTLTIDLAGRDQPGISATGKSAGGWIRLQSDVEAGTTSIELAGQPGWRVGQVVELEQDNDQSMYTKPEWRVDWGEASIGEMGRVESVDQNRVTLSRPLLSHYRVDAGVRIRAVDAVNNVGLESLRLFRRDEGYGNTVSFSFAADVWLDEVTSRRTSRAHVALDRVLNCRIGGSVFHDATDFGDGGRAYGVSLARHTTGCAVSNNALYDLRHAIIMQLGTSGNVIAYNDARGSAGYADRQPRADLSLHGHWPQANLFEGNVFDRVVFADWWGPSGPGNLLYRSCALDHVIVMDQSDDQLVVGNLIGPGGLRVDSDITGLINQANRAVADPADVDLQNLATDLPVSLWLESRPEFLADSAWPPISPADGVEQCRLPASSRSPLS